MTWVAAADFRRAKDESLRAQPCQVYGKVERLNDQIMIGAVASGLAGARLSHLGARIAVRSALNSLRRASEAVAKAPSDATGDRARTLYAGMVAAIRDELRAAVVDHVAPIQAFATTLSVFVAIPTGVAAMQIGSGLMVSRGRSGDYSVLFSEGAKPCDPTPGYVTDPDPAGRMRVSVQDGPVAFLCAASAPLEHLSIRRRDGLPQKEFFGPLDRYASTAPDDEEVHRGIRSFLRSERIHGRLDHDFVLALCGYRRQGELFGSLKS
jgi:hypothetical protein